MIGFSEYLEEQVNYENIHEHDFEDFFQENFMELEVELDEKSRSEKFTKQPWEDGKDIEETYALVMKHVDANKKTFLRMAKSAAKKARNAKVYVGEFNVKPFSSFKKKVQDRGKKASELTDVMRTTITVQSADDVEMVSKQILKDFVVVDKKGGLIDAKTKGKDKDFGYYGSNHFLVNMNGLVSEIQVMTKRLSSMKDEAHKFYDKHRVEVDAAKKSGKALSPETIKDMQKSKKIFSQGNRENKYFNRGK
ncbi:RelA/SpoT family protein [Paraglaciecola Antarctic GD virus 1]|nr:RelA/SpoT family protein [Paraglaciecola Antarctic GD virus 1]